MYCYGWNGQLFCHWFDATLNVICSYLYLCKEGYSLKIPYFSGTIQEDVGNIKLIEEYIVCMATTVDGNRWFR